MKQLMKQFIHDESGQDLIEYALVAAVIALGAVAAMTSLAGAIGNGLNSVGNNFNSNV
jgi:pilus assembly protein Flp/PilA